MLEQVLAKMSTDKSFDLVTREILIGGKQTTILFVDGFIKDEVFAKMMDFMMKITPEEMRDIATAEDFMEKFVPYVEVAAKDKVDDIIVNILSGNTGMFLEGFDECILIDSRTYPQRSIQEPDKDKVLRGSHEGFVETVVFNTALIRRRLRDPHLTMEITKVGKRSQTDVVLCYLDNKVDKRLLAKIQQKIKDLSVNSLTMTMQSLAEVLVDTKWFNPLPKVRYTERPDVAAACVQEGKLLVLIDNTPSVMILPTSFFDFFEEADDFYFPPVTGTYMRLIRLVIFLSTLVVTPLWLLYLKYPGDFPQWMSFLQIREPNGLPVIVQLLLLELAVDGLRMASVNTPDILSSSLSIVGALLLGEFAVRAGIFVPDTILFSAFTATAIFTQPDFELGYAFKFGRILLLVLTNFFGYWGFGAGLVFELICILFNRDISGRSYLYPLIPFDWTALKRKFVREKISHKNS